jgi:hypothetical protein
MRDYRHGGPILRFALDSPLEEAGFEPSVPPDAVRADYAGYIAWRGSFEK